MKIEIPSKPKDQPSKKWRAQPKKPLLREWSSESNFLCSCK